ncbi:MAG: rhodanese-like domain-containing protein [Desulfobacterales bacterium]|nr:rhodanese-like domain-containing protein [Desulfobacterales bacterium]
MKKYSIIFFVIFCIILIGGANFKTSLGQNSTFSVSGKIINGLRQIELAENDSNLDLHVYRGDYVQFLPRLKYSALFTLEALKISETIPLKTEKPYITFKELGVFSFKIDGAHQGTITVHKLERSNYTEVNAKEAQELIQSIDLFLLDVRTVWEFQQGHLRDAYLLPVSDLQYKLNSISRYKENPVLIYCRSGNRSTVAAKILLDNGFKRVYNMRYGINEWKREKFEIVK